MEKQNATTLLICSICILLTLQLRTSSGEFAVVPSNQAALWYRTTTLNCTSNISNSSNIEWKFTPLNNDTQISLGRCLDGNQTITDDYELFAPDEYSCNLIIRNVTSELSGTYGCIDESNQPALADVIVLDSRPVCTVDGEYTHGLQLKYVYFNQQLLHVCSLNFTGPQHFIPFMNFTTFNTLLNSSEELTDSSLVSSQLVEIEYLPSGVILLTLFTSHPNASLPVGLNPEPPEFRDTWTVLYYQYDVPNRGGCGGCSCVACFVPVIIGCVACAVIISLIAFCVAKNLHRRTDTEVYAREREDDSIDMENKF